MGRIHSSVTLGNPLDSAIELTCDALVDTGASHLVLPSAWKPRLGDLQSSQEVDVELANHTTVQAELCGPVRIQLAGFRAIHGEVVFVDMGDAPERFEPLIGHLVLQAAGIAVDMVGHRLIRLPHFDLKVVEVA